jgi:hypothetical protein
MVHAPFRWAPIGELLDGMPTDDVVSQLEAELLHVFEQDERDIGQWLDLCLNQIEATIDDDHLVWVDEEFARFFDAIHNADIGDVAHVTQQVGV